MNKKTILITLASASLAGASASAQINLYAAWDLNEGAGTATTQYQLPVGYQWNQVANPTVNLAATVSANISTVGGSWGSAGTIPAGWTDDPSTASLTFGGGNLNTLDTNVSGTGLVGTGAKTFVAWINPTGLDTNGSTILSYTPKNGEVNGADLRFMLDVNGDLRAEVTGGFFVYDSASFVNQGWTMVAAIFDGNSNTSSFYIGGTGIVTPTSVGARDINTADSLQSGRGELDIILGGSQVDVRSFIGGIDMAAIYTGAATEAQLDAIYANGIAVVPEPATYALIGGFLAFLLVLLRRRLQ